MSEPLTKERIAELREIGRLMYATDRSELFDSHEALRAALTQSAEKLERQEGMLAAERSFVDSLQQRAEKAEATIEALRENTDVWAAKVARLERTVERLREALEAVKHTGPALCGNPDAHHKGCDCVGHRVHFALSASSPDHAGRMRRCILMVNSAGDAHAVITQAAPGYVPGLHEVYAWFEAPDHAGAPETRSVWLVMDVSGQVWGPFDDEIQARKKAEQYDRSSPDALPHVPVCATYTVPSVEAGEGDK